MIHDQSNLLHQLQNDKTRLQAFDSIYRTYNRRMWMVAFKIVRDHQAAEDVMHDMFVRFFKIGSYSHIEKLEAYLGVLCRNAALDYLERSAKGQSIEQHCATREPVEQAADTRFEIIFALQGALETIPPQQSMALRLVYLLDHDIKTAAGIMRLTTNTVKVHLRNGRKALLKKLKKE